MIVLTPPSLNNGLFFEFRYLLKVHMGGATGFSYGLPTQSDACALPYFFLRQALFASSTQ